MNTLIFSVPPQRSKKTICWQDVLRMNGDGNYTVFVYANGRKYLSSKTLSFYAPHLPVGLVRIHKRCIVNQTFIAAICATEHSILLTDGSVVKIARRRWKEIKTLFILN